MGGSVTLLFTDSNQNFITNLCLFLTAFLLW